MPRKLKGGGSKPFNGVMLAVSVGATTAIGYCKPFIASPDLIYVVLICWKFLRFVQQEDEKSRVFEGEESHRTGDLRWENGKIEWISGYALQEW